MAPRAESLRVCAPAKLNLFLHVGDKRPDGYHDLESLVVFAELADSLDVSVADRLRLAVSGPFAGALESAEDNLVMRAARALSPGNGAALALQKNLPVSSGLGGGSADAAATLRGLNALWDLRLNEDELCALGAGIGSDVPACVLSRPVWMSGRGERLRELPPLPALALVLVNPGVAVPTAHVFAALNARTGVGAMSPPAGSFDTLWDLVDYLDDAGNDLEAPAAGIAPVIEEVLEALAHEPGCVLAQMSGSGATCFGLFQDHPWAAGAAERLRQDHPGWWVQTTRIAGPEIGAPQVHER